MRLTVVRKLAIGFGVPVLLICVLGTITFVSGTQSEATLRRLAAMLKVAQHGGEADRSMMGIRMKVSDFLAAGHASDESEYDVLKTKFEQELERCSIGWTDAEGLAMLQRIREAFQRYDAAVQDVRRLIGEKATLVETKLGVMGHRTAEKVQAIVNFAFDLGDTQTGRRASECLQSLHLCQFYVVRYAETGRVNHFELANQVLGETRDRLAKSADDEKDEDEKKVFQEAAGTMGEFAEHFATLRKYVDGLRLVMNETLAPASMEIASIGQDIKKRLQSGQAETEKEVRGNANRVKLLTVAVSLISCTVASLFAFFLGRSIIRPIRGLIARIRAIQESNDLSQSVQVESRDEIGRLAESFNGFVTTLHDIIARVVQATGEVVTASYQISHSSRAMVEGVKIQEREVTQITNAIKNMSQSIEDVAGNSAKASQCASKAGGEAEQGGQAVDQTIGDMSAIKETVTSTSTVVSGLGGKTQQIGKITAVISEIADQTNLLALNAAIEAARAGDHGRGFAVVADEVRKLADRTTQATEEITRSIQEIQRETIEAVKRMQAGSDQVRASVTRATQSGECLERIVAGAQEVAGMVQSIAAAAEEQSETAREISGNLGRINDISRSTLDGAKQTAAAVGALARRSTEVQALVSRFKLRTEGQAIPGKPVPSTADVPASPMPPAPGPRILLLDAGGSVPPWVWECLAEFGEVKNEPTAQAAVETLKDGLEKDRPIDLVVFAGGSLEPDRSKALQDLSALRNSTVASEGRPTRIVLLSQEGEERHPPAGMEFDARLESGFDEESLRELLHSFGYTEKEPSAELAVRA